MKREIYPGKKGKFKEFIRLIIVPMVMGVVGAFGIAYFISNQQEPVMSENEIEIEIQEYIDRNNEEYFTREDVEGILIEYNELMIMILLDEEDQFQHSIVDGQIKEIYTPTWSIEYFEVEEIVHQAIEEYLELEKE